MKNCAIAQVSRYKGYAHEQLTIQLIDLQILHQFHARQVLAIVYRKESKEEEEVLISSDED